MMTEGDHDPAPMARGLVRSARTAALATALGGDAWPYVSLVLVAADHDGTPILMLSDLAEHARNIRRDGRVSLLFAETTGAEEPLARPRVSVLGRVAASAEARHRERFLARHPQARSFADFTDFAVWRVGVDRAHLVAGFGRIHWIEAEAFLFDTAAAGELIEAEPGIVAYMNADHAEAIDLCAHRLLGQDGAGWTMTGCDPEGCDLRRGATMARLAFEAPVHDAEEARAQITALLKRARRAPPAAPGRRR